MSLRGIARALTWSTSAVAVALTAHTAWNVRNLRRPPSPPQPPGEWVSVLLPVRDEAHRVKPTMQALLAALDRCAGRAELVVLDDGSSDGTPAVVRAVAEHDPRVRLVAGEPLPPGWLGKPWACHQLAGQANHASTVLVFVDADVRVTPDAVAATVGQLRDSGLDLVSPYPRQVAGTVAERLVQPLLQWSFLTTLPLAVAERSERPALSAANGQLLAVDRGAYERAGGHAGVRADVLDDLALVRSVKLAGGRGGVTDGTELATCRMYDGWADLRDGYGKSLWAAFGGPKRGLATIGGLSLVYAWPAAAALGGSRAGAVGYLAGVGGRVLTGRRTGARVWPDALAHPASVVLFGWLTARSVLEHRRGTLRWKGRPVR
ncbi:glycosyltransferase [Angustibacter sp. McL0619]|uniref:glycosyltransferase n=1 Tax=Angustibacter sp. McL0619 TaxID=3415676 RepID=UPI003CF3ECEE